MPNVGDTDWTIKKAQHDTELATLNVLSNDFDFKMRLREKCIYTVRSEVSLPSILSHEAAERSTSAK